MASKRTKAREGGSERPLVLVLNASPATSSEEEVENSPKALKALRDEVDIEALSQLLRVWWTPSIEEGDSTEIGLDDVAGLKKKYSEEVEGLELFALCLNALQDDQNSKLLEDEPDHDTARISASNDTIYVAEILRDLAAKSLSAPSQHNLPPLRQLARNAPHFINLEESDDLQIKLQEALSRTDAPETRIVLIRDADGASTESVLLVFTSKTAEKVRKLLESSRASQEEEDIAAEEDDGMEADEDMTANRPVQIVFIVESSNEEVNGQEGTIELIRPRFEIDLERRQTFVNNLLLSNDAYAERAWEQVTREIASFGLPLAQDFRDYISMEFDEARDNELDGDGEKPSLIGAKLDVKSDAFQKQSVSRKWVGAPQPDVAHPEQREVADEVFRKAEQVLFGQIDADWTSKFNSVSFVVLTPNFNSLQSQTADRVTRAKLEGGRVLKHTKVPYAVMMDKHLKEMIKEAGNPKTLFVIIADECHFAPTKGGAHDTFLNHPDLSGDNVLRLLVSATPQNVLSDTSRVADENIVQWFKPASMYRSMDYYVETATWAVPTYVRPLRLAVKGKTYDVDPRATTHEGCAYRYPMHEYGAFCSVFNRRVHKELGSSLANELISVEGGKENLLLDVPRDVDLDFDENFDKKTGLLYWLGFEDDLERMKAARQTAMGDRRKQNYRVGASGTPFFCDTDINDNFVDCLPRRRQRVLKDDAFDVVRGHANRSFGKRGADKRKQKKIKVAESTPLYDGHIIMADYLLSLTYLAVYRIDHDNLWNRDLSREDIFAPLEENDVRRLALDDEKLKAFALHLGFADRVWPDVAHDKDKEVGRFEIADDNKEASVPPKEVSVQHLLKVLLEATVRSAWSELNDLIDKDELQALASRFNEEWVKEAKSLAAGNHDTPAHWQIALQYVISEKLERNREDRAESQGNTSQAWYNETDRLLHDLLDVDPKYRTGRMAVIRVYETDENLSIRNFLRSALGKLGLTSDDHGGLISVVADVGGSDGKKRTPEGKVVQKVARRATSLFTQLEPWTLTRDLRHPSNQKEAETERETIVDRVNKSFAEAQAQEAEARKHLGAASHTLPSKAVQKTAKYEDLENLPTIVILCEKGRMGDTFPHSFRFLDIRLRSSKTYSTFVQEFGRVCRYPGLDSSTAVTFEVSEEKDWATLEEELDYLIAKIGVRKYFTKGWSYAVLDPGQEVRFHADSELQLKSGFRTALGNVNDGRARFGRWTVKRYVHVLPTVLMNAERYNAQLQKAIEHKYRDTEGRRRIDQCIPGPLDLYLSAGRRRAAAAPCPRVETIEEEKDIINPMHDIEAYRGRSLRVTRQIKHYDGGRKGGDDPRRLLLMAQCQQGKTGAYLHFLHLLKERVELAIPVPPDALPLVARAEWTLPHWRNLIVSAQPPLSNFYNRLQTSQYDTSIMQQRTLVLMLASENESNWQEAYLDYLLDEDGEAVQCKAGKGKIDNLSKKLAQEYTAPFNGSRCTNPKLAFVCVNFDGRFSSIKEDARANLILPNDTVQLYNILGNSAANGTPAVTSLGHRVRLARQHVQRQLWDAGSRRENMDQLKTDWADRFTQSMKAANAYESVAARSNSPEFNGKYHRKQYVVKDVKLVGEGVCLSAPYAGFHDLNLKEDAHNVQINVGKRKLLNVERHAKKHGMGKVDDATAVRWVFVPSYNRAGVALVDYEKAIPRDDSGKPTVVCIVVRSGKQFDDYVAAYGSAHIILSLPESMASKTSEGSRVYADRGGIGYARLFIQLAAHQLGLPWVWILDDNVDVCYERKLVDKVPANALSACPDACTFSTVMTGVESIVHNEKEKLTEAHHQKRMKKCKPEGPVLRKSPAPEASNQNAGTKEELTGGSDQYGLIGIRRDPRARQTESKHPFMVTYSVYSFVYMNVTSTVNAGVLFPVKTFGEDVEFNHLVDEAGLVCLKVNRFFHHKKNLKLSAKEKRERAAELSPCFTELAEALDHFGKLNGGLRPASFWSNLVPDRFEQDKRWAAEFWDRFTGGADARPLNALLTCFLEASRDDAYNRIAVRTAGELSNLLLVVRDEDINAFSEIADADDGINLFGGKEQLKIYRKARVDKPFPTRLLIVGAEPSPTSQRSLGATEASSSGLGTEAPKGSVRGELGALLEAEPDLSGATVQHAADGPGSDSAGPSASRIGQKRRSEVDSSSDEKRQKKNQSQDLNESNAVLPNGTASADEDEVVEVASSNGEANRVRVPSRDHFSRGSKRTRTQERVNYNEDAYYARVSQSPSSPTQVTQTKSSTLPNQSSAALTLSQDSREMIKTELKRFKEKESRLPDAFYGHALENLSKCTNLEDFKISMNFRLLQAKGVIPAGEQENVKKAINAFKERLRKLFFVRRPASSPTSASEGVPVPASSQQETEPASGLASERASLESSPTPDQRPGEISFEGIRRIVQAQLKLFQKEESGERALPAEFFDYAHKLLDSESCKDLDSFRKAITVGALNRATDRGDLKGNYTADIHKNELDLFKKRLNRAIQKDQSVEHSASSDHDAPRRQSRDGEASTLNVALEPSQNFITDEAAATGQSPVPSRPGPSQTEVPRKLGQKPGDLPMDKLRELLKSALEDHDSRMPEGFYDHARRKLQDTGYYCEFKRALAIQSLKREKMLESFTEEQMKELDKAIKALKQKMDRKVTGRKK